MCKVNYVTEHSRFMNLAINYGLSANEITLYSVLLTYFNSLSRGNDWPSDYVAIPNKRLLALLPFSETILIRTRKQLLERGLGIFSFIDGDRKTLVPRYKMLYFSSKASEEISPILQINQATQSNPEPVAAASVEPKPELTPAVEKSDAAQEEKPSDTTEIAVIKEIESEFGEKLSQQDLKIVKQWIKKYRYKPDIYKRAASLSSTKDKPILYMKQVLENWHKNGVPEQSSRASFTKTVSHQAYPQRQYSESEFNVWTPPIDEDDPIHFIGETDSLIAMYN